MTTEHIESVLGEIGLNENEKILYLALLQVGSAPASVLGQRTGITKSTAQYTCQQLVKKGLITKIERGNVYMFRSEDPLRLLQFLEKQKRTLQKQEERVQHIIAPLKEMMRPELVAPRIRVYEGPEQVLQGFMAMLDEVEEGGEILSFLHPLAVDDSAHQELTAVVRQWIERRLVKRITLRQLVSDSVQGKAYQQDDAKNLRETRIASAGMFSCAPSEVMIYNDTVWHLSIEQGYYFAFTAEHHALTTLQRDVFELAWQAAASLQRSRKKG